MTYVHDLHDGEFLVATYSQGKNTISVEMASTTSNLILHVEQSQY